MSGELDGYTMIALYPTSPKQGRGNPIMIAWPKDEKGLTRTTLRVMLKEANLLGKYSEDKYKFIGD